ncbi:NADP-dependent malic enzyme, mitochondrial-like [Hippocampus comes]|nr:PREDICTED: NADP-dependent malic enzyme, mitochondrial-like [Hippocampus comes]
MNSLTGRAALHLCRRTAVVAAGGFPFQAVRVCHGGESSKGSVSTKKRGYDITRNPHLNKGMAFTLEERLQLGIHGLLPPCFLSQDVQVLRVMKSYETRVNPLDKYILLMTLQDRNEKLFYRVLTSDIEEFMPIVYTPTVGLACQQYGLAFRRPRFEIDLEDDASDGDGKATGGKPLEEPPQRRDPVAKKQPLKKKMKRRLRLLGQEEVQTQRSRPRNAEVTMMRTMKVKMRAPRRRSGGELPSPPAPSVCPSIPSSSDSSSSSDEDEESLSEGEMALLMEEVEEKKKLISTIRNKPWRMKRRLTHLNFSHQAALGIAHLLMMAMAKEGLSRKEAAKRIWMVDSKGLIVKGRSHLNHEKEEFAHEHPHLKTLEEAVHTIKPTAIIGVAAIGGAFTEKIIKDMASYNERPIIFALSNPTSKAECTAEQCYNITEGRGIFASGSPFSKVTLADGRSFYPGQGNNAYVFPGVALGIIACRVRHISDDIFLTTAEAIADMVTEEHLAEGRLYPPLKSIREVSFKIAVKIVNYAYKHNVASVYPEPKDKEAFVLSHIYSPDYDSFTLDTYAWPQEAMNVQDV